MEIGKPVFEIHIKDDLYKESQFLTPSGWFVVLLNLQPRR